MEAFGNASFATHIVSPTVMDRILHDSQYTANPAFLGSGVRSHTVFPPSKVATWARL